MKTDPTEIFQYILNGFFRILNGRTSSFLFKLCNFFNFWVDAFFVLQTIFSAFVILHNVHKFDILIKVWRLFFAGNYDWYEIEAQ